MQQQQYCWYSSVLQEKKTQEQTKAAKTKMICAIDQGTTSTRVVIYSMNESTKELQVKALAQAPHKNYFPNPGWVEHDPVEILTVTQTLLKEAYEKYLAEKKPEDPSEIKAIGITNQRETTVVWNKTTGKPLYNAVGTCVAVT